MVKSDGNQIEGYVTLFLELQFLYNLHIFCILFKVVGGARGPWVDPEAEPWPTTGRVMWYDQNRGFGLCAMNNKWNDVAYVHYTAIAGGKPLKTGQRVSCNLVADGNPDGTKEERWKKVKATDLKVIRGRKAPARKPFAPPARRYVPADYGEYPPKYASADDEEHEMYAPRPKYEPAYAPPQEYDTFEQPKKYGPVKQRKSSKPKSFRAFVYDMAMDFDYMAKKFQYLANKF